MGTWLGGHQLLVGREGAIHQLAGNLGFINRKPHLHTIEQYIHLGRAISHSAQDFLQRTGWDNSRHLACGGNQPTLSQAVTVGPCKV